MNKREDHKIVEIAGRTWRIEKFDAFAGTYILYKLASQALPMGLDKMLKVPGMPEADKKTVMSKTEFMELQRDCLAAVFEMLPAGKTPVMMPNGTFGVQGLEKDAGTVVVLLIHVLMFNLMSFFKDGALTGLVKSMSDMRSASVPT